MENSSLLLCFSSGRARLNNSEISLQRADRQMDRMSMVIFQVSHVLSYEQPFDHRSTGDTPEPEKRSLTTRLGRDRMGLSSRGVN